MHKLYTQKTSPNFLKSQLLLIQKIIKKLRKVQTIFKLCIFYDFLKNARLKVLCFSTRPDVRHPYTTMSEIFLVFSCSNSQINSKFLVLSLTMHEKSFSNLPAKTNSYQQFL